MANMQMTKTPMPEQDPQVRNHNFEIGRASCRERV